ncbi:MAG: DsrE family protein [Gammaproteobacteria bacterium]|nr:DsrE family protein [Gammaproteobacteria bacterium]
MKIIGIFNVALLLAISNQQVMAAEPVSRVVQTPYSEQQVVFDFYFDEPEKINSALYWIRSLINPLMEEPYGLAPEFLDIKVIIHGTEIVTVARKNYKKYQDAVERMRYYASLGVEFKVCGLAAQDYDYATTDFYDFIEVVPSAITELAHWQLQGYALIAPEVKEKKHAVEEIR